MTTSLCPLSARPLLLALVLWLPAWPASAQLFGFSQQKTTEWVIEKVQGFLPGQLTYQSVEGPLKSPIEFQGLRYEDGELVVTIDTLVLEWSLPRLLLGTARLERLFVDGVRVQLPTATATEEQPAPEEPTTPGLPDIALPIKLDLEDVSIQDIQVTPAGGTPIQIDAVEMAAETDDATVIIHRLRLLAPQGNLALEGSVTPTGTYPLDLSLQWTYQAPDLAPAQGQGQLTGAVGETLTLTQDFSGSVQGQLNAQVVDAVENLSWQARLELAALELGLLDPQMTGNDLSGQLASEGSLADYQAQAEFATTLPELGRTTARLQAQGGTDTIRLEELTIEAADGPLALAAQADVNLQDQTVDATGRWQALAWPLVGQPTVESPRGEFAVQGTFQDYRARLEALVRGDAFGTIDTRLVAEGTDERVQVRELVVTAPDRALELTAQGSYGLADNRFDGQGQWRNLAWPLVGEAIFESPTGEFSAQGTPRDFLAQLEAGLESSDYGRIQARLEAAGSGDAIELRQLTLTDPDGPLSLQAQGRYGLDDQAIEATGQWQNLAWPLLGEPVVESPTGEFSAQGTLQDYQGRLQATVAGAQFGRLATSLDIQGNDQVVRLTALEVNDADTGLELDAQAELALANLAFQATGNWQNVAWPLVGDEPKVVTSPSGSFSANGTPSDYRAQLSAAVTGEQFGRLNADLQAEGTDQQARITNLTVTQPDGNLALEAQARVALADLNFEADGNWQNVAWPLVGDEPKVVTSPSGTFSAQGTPTDYQARVTADVTGEQFGRLNTDIQAQGTDQQARITSLTVTAPDGDLALETQARVTFADLAFEADGNWQNVAWPLVGDEPKVVTSPSGTFSAQGTPTDYQARVNADVTGEQFGRLNADLQAQGSDQQARITSLTVTDPDADLALEAQAQVAFADLNFEASGDWRNVAWPLVGDEPKVVESPSGSFSAQGTPTDYQARVTADVAGEQFGRLNADVQAQGTDQQARITSLTVTQPDGDLALEAQARVALADLNFEASGDWRNVTWPLAGDQPQVVASPSGTFSASGTPTDYQARVEAAVSGDQFGRLNADIQAQGTDQQVRITELTVTDPDGELALNAQAQLALADLAFEATGNWQGLAFPLVGEPVVESPQGGFSAQGTPNDYQASLSADLASRDQGQVRARLNAQGTDQRIRITELSLTDPDGNLALDAQAQVGFADLNFQAEGNWQNLVWPLIGEPLVQSPRGEFDAQGTPTDFNARLDADLQSRDFGEVNARLVARGTGEAIELQTLSLTDPEGELALDAQGRYDLNQQRFDASGQWQNLVWPLVGQPTVVSPRGEFDAQGTLQDYRFELSTQVAGDQIPETAIQATGQGSDQALEDFTLQTDLLGGSLRAEGQARWAPSVSWQAELTARNLDLARQFPQAPAGLGFDATTQGTLGEQLDATIRLTDLTGTLNGQPLAGTIDAQVQDSDLTLQTLDLRAGQARLQAQGTLARTWDLNWDLTVPRLAPLLPDAQGSLASSGTLSGPREAPLIRAQINGQELTVAGSGISRLDGEALVDLGGGQTSRLNLVAADLLLGGQSFQRLEVQGAGTPADHTVTVALDGEPVEADLALNGALGDDGVWNGRLTRLDLDTPTAGTWQLARPVALTAGPDRAEAGNLCLVHRPGQLCVTGQWTPAAGAQGQLTLDDLALDQFEPLVTGEAQIDTTLEGRAQFALPPGGQPRAEARFTLSPGGVRLISQGNLVALPLGGATLTAQLADGNAQTRLNLDLDSLGSASADVTLGDLGGQNRVGGTVQARIVDLEPVALFVPQLQNVEGTLTADLNLGGSLPIPAIRGALRLVDGAVEVPEAGIQVQDIQLAVVGDGSGPVTVEGSAESGNGRVGLTGRLDPATGQVALEVNGQDFRAVDNGDILVNVSPDLDITLADNTLRVDGQVVIPKALITPPDIQGKGGVSVSDDVVIVNDPNLPPEEPEPTADQPAEPAGLTTVVDVRVVLGDDVRVEALGFKGNLEGSLRVEQNPPRPPRGTGTIAVETGQYRVYGQDLNIDRGRILFSGPLDNPGLDLQVTREVEEVTAGVRVTGSARNPRLTLFSDPAMADSSVLSYLILGRPPGAGGGEDELLFKAATALGFSGGNLVTKPLAEAFDLDYLRLESGDTLEESALVLGKYLTPDLYVSYGVGLFDAVNTFSLRYNITQWLELETTTSSEATGADLIYTFER